jgi:hypothetical protein
MLVNSCASEPNSGSVHLWRQLGITAEADFQMHQFGSVGLISAIRLPRSFPVSYWSSLQARQQVLFRQNPVSRRVAYGGLSRSAFANSPSG